MLNFLKRAVQMGKLQDEAGEGGSPTGAAPAASGSGGDASGAEGGDAGTQGEEGGEGPSKTPASQEIPGDVQGQEPVDSGTGDEGGEKSPDQQIEASNDVLSTAENFLNEAGVDSQAFIDAYLQHGTFTDADKQALVDKYGEAHAHMLMYNIESSVSAIMDAKKKEAANLHEMVGGEEQFSAIMEWAAHEDSGLDEGTRNTLNDMFQKGGDYAEIATQYLYMGYNVSNGNDVITNNAQEVPYSGNVPGVKGIEPISYTDYSKGRDAARTQAEIDHLEKRARHTIEKGLAPQYNWPVRYQ